MSQPEAEGNARAALLPKGDGVLDDGVGEDDI